MKGFRYGGIIVSIGDIGIVEEEQAVNYLSNTHGGLVEIEGQWYVFYHRHTNRHRNSRQMCGEPIKIAEDGRITQTESYELRLKRRIDCREREDMKPELSAIYQVRRNFHVLERKNGSRREASLFYAGGEDREDNPNRYIANLRDGAWAEFKYFDIRQSSRIRINVRGNAEGEMLMQDEKDGEIRAVIPVRPSADWQEKSGEFHIETGVRALYFTYRGSGSIDWQWV